MMAKNPENFPVFEFMNYSGKKTAGFYNFNDIK
jgi:hypothetical protein